MKLLFSLILTVVLAAPLLAQTPASNPGEAQAQAKHELNEAARLFRDGRFAEAQVHSEKALLLDPQNDTAPYFVARTIHAQYKPGVVTSENVAKARQAILAYKRILERVPGDDEAYKAIAYLYGAIKEVELLTEWLLQRAGDVSMPNDKRAEAFVALASKDWDCSFQLTEKPGTKVTTVMGTQARVSYVMPYKQSDFEQAKECANRGLERVNSAITLMPEDESGWAYKTNIIYELAKLAEMEGAVQRKDELLRQYEEALKETGRLAKRSESKP